MVKMFYILSVSILCVFKVFKHTVLASLRLFSLYHTVSVLLFKFGTKFNTQVPSYFKICGYICPIMVLVVFY